MIINLHEGIYITCLSSVLSLLDVEIMLIHLFEIP